MKTLRLRTFICLAAFIITPSVAIAGGIFDRAISNNPVTSEKASDLFPNSPHQAVQGGTEIDDTTLSKDVKNALKSDAQTSGLDVKVKVRSGAVTLSGNAADLRWKYRAEAVAASVKGVRSVRNNMKIGS